ncbi:MAG: hypothetical protein J7641_13740 [Cyanobacteria bacterium SID2]|nr:hypothetical protein [Cyanobacteria bacterium SID2]MBP0002837.1 hypothetical protein [Cyanobacteria bacterium SBC]
MFVYVTESCKNDAIEHHIFDRLMTIKNEIEHQGMPVVQSYFEWIYPYLKRPIQNFRLIGKIVKIQNVRVLCFLDILTRGGNDYENFLDNPETYGRTHFDRAIDILKIERDINATLQQKSSVSSHKRLPPDLTSWTHRPSFQDSSKEWGVYETPCWIERFQDRAVKDFWQTYHELIYSIANASTSQTIADQETDYQNVCIKYKQDSPNKAVLYSLVELQDCPEPFSIVLLSPFNSIPSPEEIDFVGRHTGLFDKHINRLAQTLTRNDLARYSRQYYPEYLVSDPTLWGEIEQVLTVESGQNFAINFALSSEEEVILQNSKLPLFINGRAGSGKSTMLFYLFADCCRRYFQIVEQFDYQNGNEHPKPLFLTYNQKLLETARNGIKKLLRYHHEFIDFDGQASEIDSFFYPFQDFLLSKLPHYKISRFDLDKHISFYRFEQLYKNAFNQFSADECWHVIRAFIKGYSLEDMTPSAYQEIPRREKTIEVDRFQAIYHGVWRWYKNLTEEQGYWDDQDLVRTILQGHYYSASHSAIFCDEAQDFTKLELQLIVRLSALTQYELYSPVFSLPFAFAGDPLQTLNPTGFRWDSIRSAFYEQVIASLDPDGQLNLKMTFKELEANYRSSPAIVQFTNSILLWRHVIFRIREIKPQIAWKIGHSLDPQKFIFGQNLTLENLKNHLHTDPIFIVPCDEGGEIDYVCQDENLRQLFPEALNRELPKNVFSASQIKGSEYPLVVVYKFGDEFSKHYQNLDLLEITNNSRLNLALEYFFNKLYVAASRATEELIIIDSPTGEESLWKLANLDRLEKFIEKADNPTVWNTDNRVGTLVLGESLKVLDRDDRHRNARELEKDGHTHQNPDLLRRAREFYYSLTLNTEAQSCEAYALKFEGKWEEAGDRFLELRRFDEAWVCFWEGLHWQRLQSLYEAFHYNGHLIERSIVEFAIDRPLSTSRLQQFTQFLEKNIDLAKKHRSSKPWQTAIDDYAKAIDRSTQKTGSFSREQWQNLGILFEELSSYPKLLEIAGRCFFQSQTWPRAVSCWNACNFVNTHDYYFAKAQVRGFPEGLADLRQAEEDTVILNIWEEAGKPVHKNWLDRREDIGWALEKQQRYADEIEYLLKAQIWLEAIERLNKFNSSKFNVPEVDPLRWDIVRKIARSRLLPDEARNHRSQYVAFLKAVVAQSDWKSHLTLSEVGVTFERIGEFVPTLQFYERFTENTEIPEAEQREARQRWLATKRQQVEYERGVNPERAQKLDRELTQKAKKWHLDLARIPIPPIAIEEQPQIPIQKKIKPHASIEGLPPNVEIQHFSETLSSFQIDTMNVRVTRKEKALKVFLDDRFNRQELKIQIDRQGSKVKLGQAVIGANSGSYLKFRLDETCTGKIVYRGDFPRVELEFAGLSNIVKIYAL